MIGRNNKPEQPKHVVYFYTAAHPSFGDWLKKDIKKYGLQLEPDYRAWDNPVGAATMERLPKQVFLLSGIIRTDIPIITSHPIMLIG